MLEAGGLGGGPPRHKGAATGITYAIALAGKGRLTEILAAIRDGIRVHALLYFFALFVCSAAVLESMWLGLPLDLKMVMIFSGPVLVVLALMMLAGLGGEAVRLARAGHTGSLLAALGVNSTTTISRLRAFRTLSTPSPL